MHNASPAEKSTKLCDLQSVSRKVVHNATDPETQYINLRPPGDSEKDIPNSHTYKSYEQEHCARIEK